MITRNGPAGLSCVANSWPTLDRIFLSVSSAQRSGFGAINSRAVPRPVRCLACRGDLLTLKLIARREPLSLVPGERNCFQRRVDTKLCHEILQVRPYRIDRKMQMFRHCLTILCARG